MDSDPLLASLPDWAFAFALVLSRVSAAIMVLPGLGESEVPMVVRAGLALSVTVLVLPGIAPLVPPVGGEPIRVLGMVGAELLCGLLLGWLARLIALALPVAGQIAAIQIGLSSVLQPDPDLGAQTSGTSRLLALAGPVLILSSGLYALPLGALSGSYRLFPPGTLLPVGDAAQSVAEATAACFALSLRLVAPLLIAGLIWQVMLGLLARLVPSLQVYSLALPGQVLGGLLLFGLVLQRMLESWIGGVQSVFMALPGL